MLRTATALVQTGPNEVEFQEIPISALQPGEVLIRVEANGLCHSDIDAFRGKGHYGGPHAFPRILGHEIVGIVEELGPRTPAREGLSVGTRVALNPLIACGECADCLEPAARVCMSSEGGSHGFNRLDRGQGLWGGYATHVVASRRTVLYPVPDDLDAKDATLWNPLGGAIQWSVFDVGTTIGSTVAILGAGQRGLAAVLAAKRAGATKVLATGLSKDDHKLALASEFGADAVVNVETDDLIDRAASLTGGRGFDVVVDTTPGTTGPTSDAVEILKIGGTINVVGVKNRPMDGFDINAVMAKNATVRGSMGSTDRAYRAALALLPNIAPQLRKMRTHELGFDQLPLAIETLEGNHGPSINIVVMPTVGDRSRK